MRQYRKGHVHKLLRIGLTSICQFHPLPSSGCDDRILLSEQPSKMVEYIIDQSQSIKPYYAPRDASSPAPYPELIQIPEHSPRLISLPCLQLVIKISDCHHRKP